MTSDVSSALEVCFKRDVLKKSMFTLLYFTQWKYATVTPVYKEGSSSDVKNYRPLTDLHC